MYAVLQTALEPPISREVLEAAVMSTKTLAEPDVPLLQRDLFGIVVGKLPQDDALRLQAVLRTHGVETEVVSEAELPVLAAPRRPISFTVSAGGVTITDYIG